MKIKMIAPEQDCPLCSNSLLIAIHVSPTLPMEELVCPGCGVTFEYNPIWFHIPIIPVKSPHGPAAHSRLRKVEGGAL